MSIERLTMNESQVVQRDWELGVGIDRSVYSRFNRAMEEWEELEDSVANGGTLKDVAYEAADLIIIALGIVDEAGFDMERVFIDTIERNYLKYPPDKIESLMDEGMSCSEAMAKCKEEWDLTHE